MPEGANIKNARHSLFHVFHVSTAAEHRPCPLNVLTNVSTEILRST